MNTRDLILCHVRSLGFEVRMTGDGKHVVFAARDPKTEQTWVAKGSIHRQDETVCEPAEMVAVRRLICNRTAADHLRRRC